MLHGNFKLLSNRFLGSLSPNIACVAYRSVNAPTSNQFLNRFSRKGFAVVDLYAFYPAVRLAEYHIRTVHR